MAQILVIDDDECIRNSFEIVLRQEHNVDTASSGEDGIAKAAICCPDIIFLDLKMPGIGGIDTLTQLQTMCQKTHTLIMTSFYEEHMLKLKEARANGLLFELCQKPMDNKQIALITNAYDNSIRLGNYMEEKHYRDKSKQGSITPHYERHFFRLFLAGNASTYSKTIKGLRNIFNNHLNCYDLDVIDLTRNPELAERNNIIATPAITVKGNSDEPFMVIGDMSNNESVLTGLNLVKNTNPNKGTV
ncbi:MAG: response regulator [Candidatus Anammoxibacter sp.]